MKKKRLITSALPYVNNVPHLGNLTQVLSADVFARFCRLNGYETLYVCGTDEYGTASETKALQEGVTPKELCDRYHKIHKEIYSWFNIAFDYFGRTSTEKQTEIVQHIFKKVDENGYITEKEIEQLYCPKCQRFLADRYVTGECPHCHSEKARGDQCETCGTLLNPTELINPKCSVCSTTPILKKTKHLYINLPKALPLLEEWMKRASKEGFWAKNAVQITTSWIRDGLQERCITRDLKWGIPVPKEGYEDKVFYVWFDAPIGYISISANYTDDWERWWRDPEGTELFQFIGKDNIPFHTVIFPASQLATGEKWTMLYHMSSTEYLNWEGGKFSKSQGIGLFGDQVKDTGIPADVWRFYMFYNRPEKSDYSFSWNDFQDKVNKELIGNLSNFINRTLSFAKKFYSGEFLSKDYDENLESRIRYLEDEVTALLERAEERDAIRKIFEISDLGNKTFQDSELWKMRKEDPERAESILKTLVYLVKDLAIMIQPFMPETSQKTLEMLGVPGLDWSSIGNFDDKVELGEISLLFKKLEDDEIETLRKRYSGHQEDDKKENSEEDGLLKEWSEKVILKSAKIKSIKRHPEGDRLYILTLDTGEEEERTIVSSIVPFYTEEELLEHNIVLVSNLKPANFRGVRSNGMLLAAQEEGDEIHSTCEVIFADEFPVGTVFEYEGQNNKVKKADTYLKPDLFFSIPMKTKDSVVEVCSKKVGFGGKYLTVKKYKNGIVG